MKHLHTVTIILSLGCMNLFAQQQDVLSSAGNYFQNSTGSMSFTIGECLINTYSFSDMILTQGFHQSTLHVTEIPDIKTLEYEITAFPNPVNDNLTLEVGQIKDSYYILYEMKGAIIEKKEIVGTRSEISFENLAP